MTDLNKLNAIIDNSGIKRCYIAERLGISKGAFSQKTTGRIQFSVEDIVKLSKILQLTRNERDQIFLS